MRVTRPSAVILIGVAILVAGCEGTMGSRQGETAPLEEPEVVERGLAPDEEGDLTTAAIEPQTGFTGHPLDDPDSPLSKRVIYFDFDQYDVRPEHRSLIEAHARYLADHPEAIVSLEGHADERGSREYNIALGEQRANAVRNLLNLLGASGQQTRTVSYGEERPVDPRHAEEAWELNRRVEIVYLNR